MKNATEIKLGAQVMRDRWRKTVERDELSAVLKPSDKTNFVRLMNDAAEIAEGFTFGVKKDDEFEADVQYMVERCDKRFATAALLYAGVAFAERLVIRLDDVEPPYPYQDWLRAFSDTRSGIVQRQKRDAAINGMIAKGGSDSGTLNRLVQKICPDAIFKLEVVDKALNEALNAA